MKYNIPLAIPNFEGNEEKYVNQAVSEGWVSTGGAFINQLEDKMASYLDTKQCAACQSGTAALHLALVECGVGPGDLVIVPTITFIAAVNPVKYQFANPVFLDCEEGLTMDPQKLKRFLGEACERKEGRVIHRETGKQVKAIVVVHVFGNLADMEPIMETAGAYGIPVVEDATEALGSRFTSGRFAGRMAGTIGDFGAYSFNGNKIITTGGGGMITAKNPETVDHIRYLSTQAKDDQLFYVHNEVGYNYRMTNVQAALGVAQMEELESFIERKRRNYRKYQELFKDCSDLHLLAFRDGTRANCWFYALELNMDAISLNIRKVVEELGKRGVGTRPIWGLIHEQRPYTEDIVYEIELADRYASCIINIPCSTQISGDEITYTAETMKGLMKEVAR